MEKAYYLLGIYYTQSNEPDMKQNTANVKAVPTLQKHTSKLGNNMSMLHDSDVAAWF